VVYEVFFELVFGGNVCLQLRVLLKGMTDSDKNMAKEQLDTIVIVASFYSRRKKFKSMAHFLNGLLWYF
jgi:hypothetical protein